MTSPANDRQLRDLVLQWTVDPAQYVRDVFQAVPEPFQERGLRMLADHDRIAIRSGHGVGKTTLAAWAIYWYLTTHFPCRIPATAPTSTQLEDVLWAELGLWHQRMPTSLRKRFSLTNLRLELVGAEQQAFAVGRTSRKERPEALQGFHSDNLMFVIDEASGVDDLIFEVASGALSTPGAKVLMCSNPTRTTGYFYDAFHATAHMWQRLHVASTDSSRVGPQYAEEQAARYGAESDVYRVRVLGEFPLADVDTVIPLYLIEEAAVRDVAPIENIMPVWGLDVARYGSCRTALVKRRANEILSCKAWAKRDTMEVAGLVMHEYEDTPSDLRPAVINIDAIGLGAGVADRLRELELPVNAINVAETASGKQLYANLRAELWWRAREWFEDRACRMTETELGAELSIVRYRYMSTGKILIEKKEDMMDRGVQSPDLADAFVLTFAGADRRKTEHQRYKRHESKRSASSWAA